MKFEYYLLQLKLFQMRPITLFYGKPFFRFKKKLACCNERPCTRVRRIQKKNTDYLFSIVSSNCDCLKTVSLDVNRKGGRIWQPFLMLMRRTRPIGLHNCFSIQSELVPSQRFWLVWFNHSNCLEMCPSKTLLITDGYWSPCTAYIPTEYFQMA